MPDRMQQLEQLEQWFNQPLGRLLLEAERVGLNQALPKVFGFNLLQLGGPIHNDYLQASPINYQVRLSPLAGGSHFAVNVQSEFDELPFLQNSVDLIVVPHVLEYLSDYRKLLNEIYHVLAPEGRVIIFGFNPSSLWGLYKLTRHSKATPFDGKFISAGKIKSNLLKLGFNLLDHKTFFFRPSQENIVKLHKWLFLESIGQLCWPYFGASFMLVASKAMLQGVVQQRKVAKRVPLSVVEGVS